MKRIIASVMLMAVSSSASVEFDSYKEFIEHWEGRVNAAYFDSLGHSTIGIGHKNDEGYDWLSDRQIDMLFYKDLGIVIDFIEKYVPEFHSKPLIVRFILVDMGFNLGEPRFAKFKRAIKACNDNDWRTMALELENSLWYNQVGRRSRHHVGALLKLDIMEGK